MCRGWMETNQAPYINGWIPKRPKGPDCKSGGTAFAGSNPAPPIPVARGPDPPGDLEELNRTGPQARTDPKDRTTPLARLAHGPGCDAAAGRVARGCNAMV